MAVVRCPACDNPLTRSEAASGNCPACGKSLAGSGYHQAEEPVRTNELCTRNKLGWFSAAAIACGVIYFLRSGWWRPEVLTHRQFGISAFVVGLFGLWLTLSRGWPWRLGSRTEMRLRLLCVWLIGVFLGGVFVGSDFDGWVLRGTSIPVAYLGYGISALCLLCIWLLVFEAWPVSYLRR